ncbi:MAG: DUF177 domain-containing protein [Ottowia sp.]|nr:DUF177 domain-containing protein [Ottowia sp.]
MAFTNAPTLDLLGMAEAQESLSGAVPLRDLARLRTGLAALPPDAAADWQAEGLWRDAGAQGRQPALHLRIRATLPLICQRCLETVPVPVQVDRHFVFAPDEETAARWDAELEDDVLVLQRPFDLAALLEDELILALPAIPRHAHCDNPPPLATQTGDFDAAAAPENPFAVLAGYGRKPRH